MNETPQMAVRRIYTELLQGKFIDDDVAKYIQGIGDLTRAARESNERSILILDIISSLFEKSFDGKLKLIATYGDISTYRSYLAAFSMGQNNPWCMMCYALGTALESLYPWVHVYSDGTETVAGPTIPFEPDERFIEWVRKLSAPE